MERMNNAKKKAGFSVIIAVYDQAPELAEHLPSLLAQQYEDYEVIVVDESSTDETADVLKQMKDSHPQLYTTFLPKYHFQKNRRRLACTIGVKAAKHEWVIIADISTPPPSPQWLEELAQQADSTTTLMLGYISRKSGDMRLQTFSDVAQARAVITKAERKRSRNGHRGKWFRRLRGKYDFIVVRTDSGHDLLRYFEVDLRGGRLTSYRLKSLFTYLKY